MADYTTRTVHTERREFVLRYGPGRPTNWAEIGKVFAAISAELRERGRDVEADDAVLVTATDEEIIFYYEREENVVVS